MYVTPEIIAARAAVAEARRRLDDAKSRAFPDGPRAVPITKGGHADKRDRARKEARYVYDKCCADLLRAQDELRSLETVAISNEIVAEVVAEERGVSVTVGLIKSMYGE